MRKVCRWVQSRARFLRGGVFPLSGEGSIFLKGFPPINSYLLSDLEFRVIHTL